MAVADWSQVGQSASGLNLVSVGYVIRWRNKKSQIRNFSIWIRKKTQEFFKFFFFSRSRYFFYENGQESLPAYAFEV